MLPDDPHRDQEIFFEGNTTAPKSAMILIHGRGASAQSILSLTKEFHSDNYIYVAPQAYQNTWYPYSFLSPVEANEPGLSSGLNTISRLKNKINELGVPDEQIILLGFSQGACLILEYAARNVKKYKAVIGLSGGLIGEHIDRNRFSGSFNKCTVFLGCSNIDFHIPVERVHQTAEIMEELQASVTKRIYTGMGHTINDDEIKFIKNIL